VSSTHRHASHRDSSKLEFDTEAIAQGQVPSRRMLMVGRGPIPYDIAGWLGAELGEEAAGSTAEPFLRLPAEYVPNRATH
jgi:hypothetical protein